MVALYDRNRNIIQIIGGPWKSGHWGHDSYGTDVRLEDALIGIYPRGFSIEDKYVEIIKQYILRNGLK